MPEPHNPKKGVKVRRTKNYNTTGVETVFGFSPFHGEYWKKTKRRGGSRVFCKKGLRIS